MVRIEEVACPLDEGESRHKTYDALKVDDNGTVVSPTMNEYREELPLGQRPTEKMRGSEAFRGLQRWRGLERVYIGAFLCTMVDK